VKKTIDELFGQLDDDEEVEIGEEDGRRRNVRTSRRTE
jgi:hypothetical protein